LVSWPEATPASVWSFQNDARQDRSSEPSPRSSAPRQAPIRMRPFRFTVCVGSRRWSCRLAKEATTSQPCWRRSNGEESLSRLVKPTSWSREALVLECSESQGEMARFSVELIGLHRKEPRRKDVRRHRRWATAHASSPGSGRTVAARPGYVLHFLPEFDYLGMG
jgi:hypothetical protein